MGLQITNHLADSEKTHDHGHHGDPVAQIGEPEGETVVAGNDVHAHTAQDDPDRSHHQAFEHGAAAQEAEDRDPQDHQPEVLGWSECERDLCQEGSGDRQGKKGEGAADE